MNNMRLRKDNLFQLNYICCCCSCSSHFLFQLIFSVTELKYNKIINNLHFIHFYRNKFLKHKTYHFNLLLSIRIIVN